MTWIQAGVGDGTGMAY